jgi:xylulokinase
MSVTIGVDIGTTGTKTLLFDTTHGALASASRETTLYSTAPGFAEADTHQWMANVVDSIREVRTAAGVAPEAVEAISVSGMVPAVVPVDANGNPLRRAILQNDARAHQQVTELCTKLAETDLVSLTGSALTQQSVAPTLIWLRDHEPEVYRRTAHVVGSYDWVLTALGAEKHVEQNWALESGLFTIDGEQAAVVLDAAGVDRAVLTPVHRPGTRVGGLSADLAEQTGLRPGTALVVGGADHVLSA